MDNLSKRENTIKMERLGRFQTIALDDGMIHESVIDGEKLIISQNPFSHLNIIKDGLIYGYVAIEEGHLENEGGNEFGVALSEFHGSVEIV